MANALQVAELDPSNGKDTAEITLLSTTGLHVCILSLNLGKCKDKRYLCAQDTWTLQIHHSCEKWPDSARDTAFTEGARS